MKNVKNQPTKLVSSVQKDTEGKDIVSVMSYVDLIKLIMDIPPKEGYTISEMRNRLNIYSKLVVNEKDEIILEDAEFIIVKKAILEFKWAQAHSDIVAFVDYIESL